MKCGLYLKIEKDESRKPKTTYFHEGDFLFDMNAGGDNSIRVGDSDYYIIGYMSFNNNAGSDDADALDYEIMTDGLEEVIKGTEDWIAEQCDSMLEKTKSRNRTVHLATIWSFTGDYDPFCENGNIEYNLEGLLDMTEPKVLT